MTNSDEFTADSEIPLANPERPYGTTMVHQYKSVEDVLQRLGVWNPKLIYIVCSMGLIWGLTAMPIMCSAFINTGISCPTNETSCLEEKERMHSITDEVLSDKIGRKPIVMASLFFMGLFGILSAFVNSFGLFLTARFMQGFFFTASSMVNWVLACESISIKAHAHASMIFGLCWVLGYCAVAVIAYFLPNWRHIMLGVSIPGCVFAIIFLFTVPESFHFIIEKRQKSKAEKWIRKVERPSNRVDCNMDMLFSEVHKDDPTHERKANFDEAIKFLGANKIYIVYLLVSSFMWVLDFMIYNGMSLFSTALVGDPYINYVLSGLVEIPAYILSPELLNRLGRKKTVIISHIFTAICLFLLLFVSKDYKSLYIALWLAGKLGTSTSFMCLFVYGSEIFPTCVRNTCMGLCAMLSNLGAVIAPHVKHMEAIYPGAPHLIFGISSLICGVMALVFPETHTYGPITYHEHI